MRGKLTGNGLDHEDHEDHEDQNKIYRTFSFRKLYYNSFIYNFIEKYIHYVNFA